MNRGTRILLAAALSLGSACASHRARVEHPRPAVVSTLMPHVAFVPLTVVLVVRLQGTDAELAWAYCAPQTWDWGNGSSARSEDCEPWAPGAKPRTRFVAYHDYHEPGEYEVRFWLGKRLVAVERLDALPRTGPTQ